MDFSFFESLSKKEAELYLQRFLSVEKEGFGKLKPDLEKDQITVDYTFESISTLMIWISKKLIILPREIDKSLPSWITETKEYKENLFDFDDPSKILIMRVAYYFGECFVRYNSDLSWSIGNRKTAMKNMPVVTGFRFKMELAPMLVCENLFSRLMKGNDASTIVQALESWKSFI